MKHPKANQLKSEEGLYRFSLCLMLFCLFAILANSILFAQHLFREIEFWLLVFGYVFLALASLWMLEETAKKKMIIRRSEAISQ